jgi:hypothetical protein
LPLLKNCEQAKVKNGGEGGDLRVKSASGLACGSSLPTSLPDRGRPRRLTGRHGVRRRRGEPGGGRSGDDHRRRLTAEGRYGCSANGYLSVTIGSQSVRVPITCTV